MPKAKTYVIVHPDSKTIVKGLFRKPDRYPLERDFPVEFVKRYFIESPQVANAYYQQVRNSISDRSIDIKQ